VSTPWIAAYAVLWVTVLALAFTVLGLVRRIGGVLEGLERRLSAPAADFGAAVGSTVPPFELADAEGRRIPFGELVTEPTLLLVMSEHCAACTTLAEQLDDVGASIGGAPIVVVTNAEPGKPYPAALPVLYERAGEATNALDNRATPQAYMLDPTGRVLARRVPSSRDHLEEMAREHRRRAENGAGAAATATDSIARRS
jgi:hypothetical protein